VSACSRGSWFEPLRDRDEYRGNRVLITSLRSLIRGREGIFNLAGQTSHVDSLHRVKDDRQTFLGTWLAIETSDYVANDGKIRERLGWAPRVGLRDGLARSLDYYREHAAEYW
jgi:hypothetical protein